MIAGPAEYDRVVAEHVLALGKTLDKRAQHNERLRGFSRARIFDRIAVKSIRGFYRDDISAIRGIGSSSGESGESKDRQTHHQHALNCQAPFPMKWGE